MRDVFVEARTVRIRVIAERLGLSDDVFSRTALRCPFHRDSTPSMWVYEHPRHACHCFSCGFHSDGTGLVARLLGCSTLKAARWIAGLDEEMPGVMPVRTDDPPAVPARVYPTSKIFPAPEHRLVERFAAARRLPLSELVERWRVQGVYADDRPALRYPTGIGIDRLKFIDGSRPKYRWARRGGHACWYGRRAVGAATLAPLYIVNGEPSTWACVAAGVWAVCTLSGETGRVTPKMLDQLLRMPQAEHLAVRVVYDRDAAGDSGGAALVAAIRAAGLRATQCRLPEEVGESGDVQDLHRIHGSELGVALNNLGRMS